MRNKLPELLEELRKHNGKVLTSAEVYSIILDKTDTISTNAQNAYLSALLSKGVLVQSGTFSYKVILND